MKKLITLIVCIFLLLITFLIIFSQCNRNIKNTGSVSKICKNNGDRIKFISSYGWQTSENAVEKTLVIIPEIFSDTLNEYNIMQKSSGFDLEPYSGHEVTRFSYKVLNHPLDSEFARVNLYVYKDEVIAADVMSTKLGGFMHPINKTNISEDDINIE